MNVFLIILVLVSLFIYNVIQSVFLLLTPRRFRRKKDITGQKILITGAGNGLGRQLAIQFSKHATCLILLDINKVALKETADSIDSSSRVFIYECDVTNRKMVYAVAKKIKDDIGDVDILVNNAGTVCGKSFIDLPDEKILKTMDVNAISHFWLCKSFLPSMMARNSGHIVTIASLAGHMGNARLTDYSASKCAAIGFSECLEIEMRSKNLDGIKVTIVCPSFMTTGLFEGVKLTMGKPLTPEYAAEEVVHGVLEERETIFLPHFFGYMLMLKQLSPRWLIVTFLELSNNLTAMENFKGRSSLTSDATSELANNT